MKINSRWKYENFEIVYKIFVEHDLFLYFVRILLLFLLNFLLPIDFFEDIPFFYTNFSYFIGANVATTKWVIGQW